MELILLLFFALFILFLLAMAFDVMKFVLRYVLYFGCLIFFVSVIATVLSFFGFFGWGIFFAILIMLIIKRIT